MIFITENKIELKEIELLSTNQKAGAVTIFIGTVRNETKGRKVIALTYEAYQPMAIAEIEKIIIQTKTNWEILSVTIWHRIGKLLPGDIAVVIAVCTPHRKDSFAACEFIIDTLKQTVPIWKKERFDDGEVWVSAHP